ncbi:MAG: hypothetical protein IPH88_09910 [Bacteroidales bacterium]|nr:hypothetical protein [Bacteroidales bacterium]
MDSPIIDLVILLTFTYFTSSLILSSINEGISQGIFHLREKNLKKAIEILFISDAWKSFVKTDFLNSPHIRSLMKTKNKYPTYIPSNNFFLFVIEKIGAENYKQGQLQAAIKNANLPNEFKSVLMDLAAQGDNRLDLFERNLTKYYDDALDHSTIWYRKNIRRILLLTGFILAVALNIDTIKIANDALTNTKDLSHTVDKIIDHLPNFDVGKDSTATVKIRNNKGEVTIVQQLAPVNAAPDTIVRQTEVSGFKNAGKVQLSYEEATGYFLGYKDGDFRKEWFESGISGFLEKLLGVLITAFAVQLGSNFWFDIMKKALSMRSPGKKLATTKETTDK